MLNINFPISSLISGFENPASGRRGKYRNILRERFFFVEWRQQLDILESFARSMSKTDRTWICKLLVGSYKETFHLIEILYANKRVQALKETLKENYIPHIREPAVNLFFQTYQ